ncbi:S41 family peptidase [Planococcus sp. CAU13]|uniref:S41 family peptidase n=1 Tax=Planococcus sp. CAU13 TaxID=1541197 RepID=UPI00053007BD|nr:S41 family peptidase [Planococcus sp. CAU13]
MFSKTEIFSDIIQIVKMDYAGAAEKQGVNRPEEYLITDEMEDRDFIETVQSYLLDFKDGHLSFNAKGAVIPNLGFRARRYENELYVTEATEEKRLQKGDQIVEIDGLTVEEFGNRHSKVLEDTVLERQFWNVALRKAEDILVVRDGVKFGLSLHKYERTPYIPSYELKKLNPDTVYMKLTDFAQEKPILDLLEKHKDDLNHSANLIIDIRVNYGGNDMFYFPILDYVFNRPTSFNSLFQADEVMYTNYTERNCRLWINTLRGYLEQELDAETEKWAKGEIALFEKNKGKGLQVVQNDLDYSIQGQAAPQNVYVLTDVMCGSSGDTFAKNVKKSPKVQVVGRPTMGIIDFCNVTTMDYGDYEFGYSISKMDEKYYTNETGVTPHVHIPWTPEHLEEDVDLEWVMGEIERKSVVAKELQ